MLDKNAKLCIEKHNTKMPSDHMRFPASFCLMLVLHRRFRLPLLLRLFFFFALFFLFSVGEPQKQVAAVVKWHRETLGMVALYHMPPQMTSTPVNDPAKSPFQASEGGTSM